MLDKITMEPPSTIGIVGGGQLGKMMTVAAKQLGFRVIILDPQVNSPAGQLADEQIVASFHDQEALRCLAVNSQVVTYEFEHIDSKTLIELEQGGCTIHPNPVVLKVIQHKLEQKKTMVEAGIPVPQFVQVKDREDILKAADNWGYPLLLKSCVGGYDGKGNFLISTEEEVDNGLATFPGVELMVEEFVPFTMEVSVITARGADGSITTYQLGENQHEDNILIRSIIPADVGLEVAAMAREIAGKVTKVLNGVGVFCVEMFICQDGSVLVNEVAPRPHNSGHYTIEACVTSQFEQHIRAIVGLPLGDTRQVEPAVMINLLGEPGYWGPAVLTGCAGSMLVPGVHIHFYGKEQTKPKRKMGHVTITAKTLAEALSKEAEISGMIRVISMKEDDD